MTSRAESYVSPAWPARTRAAGVRAAVRAVVLQNGLPQGQPTVRIALAEGSGPAGSAINFDRFRVLGADVRGPVRFISNNQWNTPNFGWGNYVKDLILVGKGYTNVVRFRFSDRDV